MNLFVAILLNAFADADSSSEVNEVDEAERARAERKVSREASPDADRRRARVPSGEDDPAPPDTACCFPRDSPLRQCCDACLGSSLFQNAIIAVILFSSVTLGLDSPRVDPTSSLATALSACDRFFLVVFTLELLIKVISLGLLNGPTPYLRSGWNLLDLAIVGASYGALLAEIFPQLSGLRSLRVLRVLRPLRLVARDPGMKLIVRSLFEAMPDVSNVFGVVLTFQIGTHKPSPSAVHALVISSPCLCGV